MLTWQNDKTPLYNGTDFNWKTYYDPKWGSPSYFDAYKGSFPVQTAPAKPAGIPFMGWDTRFADATGQYSLNQVAGESYCSELDTGANGT